MARKVAGGKPVIDDRFDLGAIAATPLPVFITKVGLGGLEHILGSHPLEELHQDRHADRILVVRHDVGQPK
jgi:hypothetical protein